MGIIFGGSGVWKVFDPLMNRLLALLMVFSLLFPQVHQFVPHHHHVLEVKGERRVISHHHELSVQQSQECEVDVSHEGVCPTPSLAGSGQLSKRAIPDFAAVVLPSTAFVLPATLVCAVPFVRPADDHFAAEPAGETKSRAPPVA